jgi:hypothetical protein
VATYRTQISWQFDSAFARDAITINPHFNGDNPGALADALMTNLQGVPAGPTLNFSVKVYDALKPKPNPPLVTRVHGTSFTASTHPREVALCLSYYSTYNQPRYRGRLYIPAQFIGGTLGLRPDTTQMANAMIFRTILTTGLPPAHNWVVYSPTAGKSYGVSNCWVDDEWDIIRSRGLRGTTRQLATVP